MCATVCHKIADSLLVFKSAYCALKHLEVYYGGKKLQELISLELRAKRLHFADHYRPICFITDFENSIKEYSELGTTFDDKTLVVKFLLSIDSCNTQGHPYAIFYNTMQSQSAGTFEHVKRHFFNINN